MNFVLRSAYYANILNESEYSSFCQSCKTSAAVPKYENCIFHAEKFTHFLQKPNAKGLNRWPMSIGSFKSLLLHEDVVAKLAVEIEGVNFHRVMSISGKILDTLKNPPVYYKVEPLGYKESILSPDEFSFSECACGLQISQKTFGEFRAPFKLKKVLQVGEDFFKIKHFEFWVCVTKKVIDVLVRNNWTEDFRIGERALPGIKITEFGETWYEDALQQLKISFPESIILE
jgi:hypothetical protein